MNWCDYCGRSVDSVMRSRCSRCNGVKRQCSDCAGVTTTCSDCSVVILTSVSSAAESHASGSSAEASTSVASCSSTPAATDLSVVTWNINHFGLQQTPRNAAQAQGVQSILGREAPDLLVLQEVNNVEMFSKALSELGLLDTWTLVPGPLLFCEDSAYVRRFGKYAEFCPLLHSADCEVRCRGAWFGDRLVTGDKIGYVSTRPSVVYEVICRGAQFLLVVVHTSPSAGVEVNAIETLAIRSTTPHPMLFAGDWYLQADTAHKSMGRTLLEPGPWAKWLATGGLGYHATRDLTNLPGSGSGMVADYFVADATFTLQEIAVLRRGGSPRYENLYGWSEISDHVPVLCRYRFRSTDLPVKSFVLFRLRGPQRFSRHMGGFVVRDTTDRIVGHRCELGDFDVQHVADDGNCFYDTCAVFDQGRGNRSGAQLRQELAARYPALSADRQRIGTDREYATLDDIREMATHLGVTIVVHRGTYSRDHGFQPTTYNGGQARTLHVLFVYNEVDGLGHISPMARRG